MAANSQPNSQTEFERLDAAASTAIAACDGDTRSAIRALILANEFLEYEVCELMKAVAKGGPRSQPPADRKDWYD